ncbi:hypothetical protein CALVIDRAFT_568336 [Calocera viscosa TUFC12733]|uniref:BRCT domain-containing protein n=1 Tax=Calocera viscosa (strain TUFC12733) TaxID=1330018 RepID=A0A167H6T8_CALVF|nr:hypothetical protein CALVIDRAFT_568336 [Calocera viscosa TUFC12733]
MTPLSNTNRRTGMKIVLPHWLDDSFKAVQLVPTRMYEFPNPLLLAPAGSHNTASWKASEKHSQLFKSVNYAKPDQDRSKPRQNELFGNQRVRLSDSLPLSAQRREAVEARIRDAGGRIVENDGHEFYSKKIFGTLQWLERTVTNYTGPARDYVELLIKTLGAKFTPTTSGSTTLVVACYRNPNEPVSAKMHAKRSGQCQCQWRKVEVRIPKEEQADSESETEVEASPVKSGKSALSTTSAQSTPTRNVNGKATVTDADVDMNEEEVQQPEDEDEVD